MGNSKMTKSAAGAILAVTLAAVSLTKASPPAVVYVDPLLYNVVGANYTNWRNSSLVGFNPTNTPPPFIQVFDPSFLEITGSSATIRAIASNPGYAFAHEAPIYVPDLNLVFFSNLGGGPLAYNSLYNNSVIGMINMTEVDMALASTTGDVNVQVHTLDLPDTVQMADGGTGPYKGDLLFVTMGRALLPPSVVRVNPNPPYNTTVLLDNFLGRQFNSLNDVKVLPGTDIIFFTDPAYGWLGGVRPPPLMPEQVYSFDPSTGQVRVVADKFVHPNGIAFAPDGRTAFVTDTGGSIGATDQTVPTTIYQYDVNPSTHSFENRRVFAYADSGAPDGIQLDSKGNVYSGCGEGTHVWNPEGALIGKFYINSSLAQMIFTKSGLVILDNTVVYLVNIQAQGMDLATP
ncbi:calcium-dependent phosphotriesterase [Suillus ampliporus]|nr:calcium-dependent phosphotriesterase [Suillus ampliporus]